MDCSYTLRNLIFFHESTLDEAGAKRISQHIEACPRCRQHYARLQQSLDLLPSMKKEVSNPFLFTRIEARLSNPPKEKVRPRPAYIRILNTAIVGLLMLSTAYTAFYLYSGKGESTQNNDSSGEINLIAGQYAMGLSQEDMMETYYITEE